MRGSFAASLPILRQIFLCIVDSHRAVRYGGDHLPQRLGADIAHGEHTGKIRTGGFVRHDIAGFVQRQLPWNSSVAGARPTLMNTPSQARSRSAPVLTSFSRSPVRRLSCSSAETVLFQQNSTLGAFISGS